MMQGSGALIDQTHIEREGWNDEKERACFLARIHFRGYSFRALPRGKP